MAGGGTEKNQHTEDWQSLPWKKIQRNVRRLQQRIYRAKRRGDHKRARSLQRLLLRSWSARCLYDGDWPYWVERLGRDPTKPTRVIRLLKRQKNRCALCGLRFVVENIVEVHHRDGDQTNNRYANLALLHGHCHDKIHGKGCL